MKKILIIDDNEYMRFVLSAIVEKSEYIALTAGDPQKAIKEVMENKPHVVLLDKKIGDYDGLELLENIKKIDQNLPVIILTAYAEDKNAEDAMKAGAYGFITKPFDNDEIIATINKALGM